MESPAVLLKSAAIENDPQQRMDKVIKACKIITDLLPYDKKSQVLIEEPELMKYLMVCLPLNPRAIDLIIQTMIDKFKKIHYFLKETWFGFLHIAQLEESENAEAKKQSPLKLLQLGIKSLMKRGGTLALDDPNSRPIKPQNYNEQILKSKEVIKLQVLIYVEKILVYYFGEMKHSVPFKPDVPDMFRKFFTHTVSEKVINSTLDLLEKVKDIDPEFEFGDEVEDIVTSKKDSQIFLRSESSVTNLEERLSNLKRSSTMKKSSVSDALSPHNSASIRQHAKNVKKSPTKKLSVMRPEETKSDEEDITEEDEDDETESPGLQNPYEEGANAEIEEWLAGHKLGDIPSIAKASFVQEFIKDDMNIDMLVSFVVDPRFHKVTDFWRIKHLNNNNILLNQEDNKMSLSDLLNEGMVFSKLKDLKQLHPYIIRSFKTMQLLTDPKNYQLICETGANVIEKFFNTTYMCLKTREDIACNLNHILGIIEFFVSKEPSMCVGYILHYNLPFKFLLTAEFPLVQRFFMLILNCLPNAPELDNDSYKKVLEYTRITSLFVDISKVILNGVEQFPKEKMNMEYKPTGLAETIGFNPDLLPICKIEKSTTSRDVRKESFTIVEDTKGFGIDIDRIQGIVQAIKKIDKKSLVTKTNQSISRPSTKNLKRYPSLVAKNFYGDQTKTTSESEIPATKNVSINESISEIPNIASKSKQNSIIQIESSSSPTGARLSIQLPGTTSKNASPQKNEAGAKASTTTSPSKGTANTASPASQKQGAIASPNKKQETAQTTPGKDQAGVVLLKKTEMTGNGSPSRVTPASRTYLASNKAEKGENPAPERKTYLKELDLDSLGKKEIEQLKELYPTSTKNVVATPLDKEVKKPEYKVKNIKVSDQFAVRYCELLEVLFRKMLANGDNTKAVELPAGITLGNNTEEYLEKYRQRRALGMPKTDFNQFWRNIFGNRAEVFANLLTNYLLKIKIHHFDDINSGYQSGLLVNLILENMKHNNYLERHAEIVQSVCRENFGFLCKTLIQSYAWPARTDVQIYLQDFQVQDPLGTGRILLAQTLYLIIRNDAENEYAIINEINDTCWHSLVNWFFTKKNNSVYQKIFYSICEVIFLHTNEKAILNILFKLNFIYNLYKTWHEIFQNNVLLKDNHVESMYAYIKLFTKLINQTAQSKEGYNVLREQLATNASWNVLQSKLIPRPKEKKKTDKSKVKSKFGTNNLQAPPTRGDTGSNSRREHLGNTMSRSSMRSAMEKNPSSAENSPTHGALKKK